MISEKKESLSEFVENSHRLEKLHNQIELNRVVSEERLERVAINLEELFQGLKIFNFTFFSQVGSDVSESRERGIDLKIVNRS